MADPDRFQMLDTGEYSTDVNGSDEITLSLLPLPVLLKPTIYQMVPLGGSRPGRYESLRTACVISNRDPDIVELWNEDGSAPIPGNRIVVPNGSAIVRFTLKGKTEGVGSIVAVDSEGRLLSRIHVSVKKPVPLTYRLYCLTDKRRKDTTTIFNFLANGVMPNVFKIYKNQANLDFSSNGPNTELAFPDDYMGSPMYLNEKRYTAWPWSETWWWHIINAAIGRNSESTRLNIIGCAWNFEYDPNLGGYGYEIVGNTGIGGKYCLMEFQRFGLYEVASTIHEIGHALNLVHNERTNADPRYVMLSKETKGYRLSMAEIDTVTPSGTRPAR